MTLTTVKTNFTAGELSYAMLGRGDTKAYDNGALFLRNVYISPTGGAIRRKGLRFIDHTEGKGRLISFSFNTEQTYLIIIMSGKTIIYKNETKMAELDTPWQEADLYNLRWTQSADTLLVAHPDYPLKKISRYSHTNWTVSDWEFYSANGFIYQPYYKFSANHVSLSLSGLSGNITITASAPIFTAAYVGKHLRFEAGETEITGINSAYQVNAVVTTAQVFKNIPDNNTTKDWKEPAFSDIRGYPVSVTFHQGRLVIGGSRDLPNRLWFSKSGDLPNFDLGDGLDNESIEFGLLSDQVNAIRALMSGRHLQVFTSGAEWMVTGDPLTPSTIQLKRQTRSGSASYCYVPPRNIDGATIFCTNGGKGIREFLFSDIEQAYQANDLALLSPHLINYPIDMDYDEKSRLLYTVMMDGSIAVLTNYRSESVSAWTKYETEGNFTSVCVSDENVYVLAERDGAYYLEVFDEECHTDSALLGESNTMHLTWSGLDDLEGKTVNILADNLIVEPRAVKNGKITLDYPAYKIQVGLPFTHKIIPLPYYQLTSNQRAVKSVRMTRGIFKVLNTASMEIDVGMGFIPAIPLTFNKDKFSAKIQTYTKDIVLQGIGWVHDALEQPLWTIQSSIPAPFALIGVTTEMKLSN